MIAKAVGVRRVEMKSIAQGGTIQEKHTHAYGVATAAAAAATTYSRC